MSAPTTLREDRKLANAMLFLKHLHTGGHETKIKRQIGRLRVTFRHSSSDSWMGRFGGGWQWALGFEAGPSTLLFNLLVCTLTISLAAPGG